MIEILILIGLCKKLGVKARAKGLSAGGYQTLLVVGWFVSEFLFGVCTAIFAEFFLGMPSDQIGFAIWLAAIFGAAIMAWFVFKLVDIKPDRRPLTFEDDFDDDPPIETRRTDPTPGDAIRATTPESRQS